MAPNTTNTNTEQAPEEAVARTRQDAMLQAAAVTQSMPLNWLPTYSRDLSVLASLQTCSLNLNRNCDIVAELKRKEYTTAWRHPAPVHCRSSAADRDPTIYSDRLGLACDDCTKPAQ